MDRKNEKKTGDKMTVKNSGLILEGGATRGVFTAGVLDYLMEQEYYEFSYVAGVSAGACNAVDYVSRQPGRTKECMIHKEKHSQYINLKTAIKKKSLFDMDMIFDKYPNEIYPFDYDTYFESDIHCELVVTNCNTGQAEYLNDRSSKERLMKICRASSSIPVVSPMVEVDGIPYLDGGLGDSIPVIRSLKTGHKKNVLILTRNFGYRKKPPRKSRNVYAAVYRKYPELVRTILNRYRMYNKTLSYIEKWEREKKIFVIRPEIPEVSRTEQDYDTLMNFYQHGHDQMEKKFEGMKKYLESGK